MKLTCLGCYGAYPPAHGANSAYLVESKGTRILLDCGSGVLARLQEHIDVSALDAVFVSHLHTDHCVDLFNLRYLAAARGLCIKVIVQEEQCAEYELLREGKALELVNAYDGAQLTVGALTLTLYGMRHARPSLAARITDGDVTLTYSGDTEYFEGIDESVRGADFYLADCCGAVGAEGKLSHMSVRQGALVAARNGVQLLATHRAPTFDPREALLAQDPDAVLCEEGCIYELE